MTTYPDQIDNSISLPVAVDNLTPVRASVVNNLRDAIIAIEKELGTQPSSIYGSIKSRLDTLETNSSNLQIIKLLGDLGNTLTDPFVTGIQGRPVSSATPAPNNVLVWDGIAWIPSVYASFVKTLYFPILSGVTSTNNSISYTSVGASEFNITKLPVGSYTIKFQVILETTGPVASVQLYNFSTASIVTGSSLTTSSTTSVLLTTGDISADLTMGSAIYQAQIEMASGGISDKITCSMARLLIEYT